MAHKRGHLGEANGSPDAQTVSKKLAQHPTSDQIVAKSGEIVE